MIAVQVPDSFNPANPCVVLGACPARARRMAPSAPQASGLEEGLRRGLTDAGKGVGIHDLTDDTVHKVDGTAPPTHGGGLAVVLAANITDAARAAYNALFPNRLAIKHALANEPRKDWGSDTLAAGRYAMYVLNERYGTTPTACRSPPTTPS